MGAEKQKIMCDGGAVVGFLGTDVIETYGNPSMRFGSAASARPGKAGAISFVTERAVAGDSNIIFACLSKVIITFELDKSMLEGLENKFVVMVSNPRLSFAKATSFFLLPADSGR